MPPRSASAPAAPARSIAAIVVSLFKPQVKSKLSQIQQNPAKPGQRKSKEKAWISLDSLGGNEPFQGVAPTPRLFFSFSPVRAAISNSVILWNSRRIAGYCCRPYAHAVDHVGHGEKDHSTCFRFSEENVQKSAVSA
jgi:hypothetical protein